MGSMSRRQFNAALGSAAALAMAGARAQGSKLTLYAGPPEKTCQTIAQGFEKKSGIKTDPDFSYFTKTTQLYTADKRCFFLQIDDYLSNLSVACRPCYSEAVFLYHRTSFGLLLVGSKINLYLCLRKRSVD